MTYLMLDHFRRMAEYNLKANHNLYETCAQLSKESSERNTNRIIHQHIRHVVSYL